MFTKRMKNRCDDEDRERGGLRLIIGKRKEERKRKKEEETTWN